MRKLPDWKFLLTLLATIAGVVVPIYVWRVDLNANSVRIRLLAQTPLQPKEMTGVAGLKIFVDGQELKSSYLSVIELSNDGEKPIPASNFESAFELNLEGDPKILRADVTSTSPKDIRASIKFEQKSVQLQPLLLNPKDTLTIAIVTEGGVPKLQPRARIAGIATASIEDASKPTRSPIREVAAVFGSFLFFLAYWLVNEGMFNKHGLLLSRKGSVFIGFELVAAGIVALFWISDFLVSSSVSFVLLVASMVNLVAMIVSIFLGWSKKAPAPHSNNEP